MTSNLRVLEMNNPNGNSLALDKKSETSAVLLSKKSNNFSMGLKSIVLKGFSVLALLASVTTASAQCTLTFPANTGSVPVAGSTLYFTDCDGNNAEVVSWTEPTVTFTGTCGTPTVSQGGGPTNGSSVPPGNYVVTYTAQAVNTVTFSLTVVTYSFNVSVQGASPTAGGITNAQTICNGSTPGTIASSAAGTQGAGSGVISGLTYEWQSSIDNSTFNTIPGAIASTYSPGALTQTTYYRRRTVVNFVNTPCPSAITSGYTPSLTITVLAIPTAGAIGSDQIFCTEAGDPALFTNVTSGTGTGGALAYSWYLSTDLGVSYTTISGITTSTYDAPAISNTTFYARATTVTIASTGEVCYSPYTAPVKVGDWSNPVIACQINMSVASNNGSCQLAISDNSYNITATDPEACLLTYD